MKYNIFLLSLILLFITSCKNTGIVETAAVSENGNINVVIEIPAGTNRKIEFDYSIHEFRVDQRNGRDRIINYLPYPGNYGFIPGTLMDTTKGGDGDALDIIILCPYMPTGTIIEVLPLGMMKLMDDGEIDNKLIAIPVDEEYQTIQSKTFADLKVEHPGVIENLENWFTNYKGQGEMQFEGWANEEEAMGEILKWKK